MEKSNDKVVLVSLIGIALFSGFVNILGFAGPLFMLQVYDRVIPSGSIATLVSLLFATAGLYAFAGMLDVIRLRLLTRVAGLIDYEISGRVLRVIARAPLRYSVGADTLKPAHDLDQIRSFLGGTGAIGLLDLPWMPVYLIVCFWLHPLIGWLAAIAIAMLMAITLIADIFTRSQIGKVASVATERNRFGEAVSRNSEAIAAMGMLPSLEDRWSSFHLKLTEMQRSLGDAIAFLATISRTIRQMIQSGTLALGAYLVIQGDLTAGTIIASSIIVSRTLQPIEQIIANWRSMTAARESWVRLRDTCKDFPPSTYRTDLGAPNKVLLVDAISSAPPGDELHLTIRNVSFRAVAGTAVGIIGPSASGKSSIARVITGVWPTLRGNVNLDGASTGQWHPDELGKYIGYLPQNFELFPGTIAENISRLRADRNDDSVIAAAKAAGAHELIVSLPKGYETDVGNGGAKLSAGQRQRIALARALFGDPFLVVLDEPNSNLDAEGDRALAEAISSVKRRGGIVLVIAHRSSVLTQVEHLLVVERGSVKAFGARDEVLAFLRQEQAQSIRVPTPNLSIVGERRGNE